MNNLATSARGFGFVDGWGDDRLFAEAQVFYNVKEDFTAVGSGLVDDRAAIQAAIDAIQASPYGGALYFPSGRYKCNVLAGIPVFTLSGPTIKPMLFIGDGISSEIFMAGNAAGGDKRLFDNKNGMKYVTWKNLELHGELTNESEQQHLLHFENASASTDLETGRCAVIDVYFGHVRGDQTRFLGNDTKRVKDILYERCYFTNYSNAVRCRSAVSFQRAADEISVINSLFGKTGASAGMGSLEMEPTGTGTNERNMFFGNHFQDAALSLTGNGSGQEHVESIFAYNTVHGYGDGLDVETLTVKRNHFLNDQVGVGLVAFSLRERIHRCAIIDNIMRRANDTGNSTVLSIDYHSVGDNYGLHIAGNLVEQESNATDNSCISIRPVKRLVAEHNMCFCKVSTAAKGFFIRVEAPIETVDDIVVRGNYGRGTNLSVFYGLGSISGGAFGVSDNYFKNVTWGTQVVGAFDSTTIVTRNMLLGSSGALRLTGSPTPTFICVDGTPGARGVGMYYVTVDPEAVIAAKLGSIALRTAGGTTGQIMNVKGDDDGLASGWDGV